MQVRIGFNTEYGRHKCDVTIDEVDFGELCLEQGITEEFYEKITSRMKFSLMRSLAEMYSDAQRARIAGEGTQEAQQAQASMQHHLLLVQKAKQYLGVPDGKPAS